jgi:ribonuclease J
VRIKTPNGTIADTGDFRFDYTPIGNKTDFARMEQIGNEGLDLLISDSTNAMTDKHSPSEKGILLDIEKFMKQAKGKIIFTTFASNQTRVRAVIELAEKLNRKVVTFGRSMVTGVDIGVKLGNINISRNTLIDKKQISKYQDNELFILTTGSQGEKFSALVNMSKKKHAQVQLKKDDLILFSASPIPGNRIQIEQLINQLSKLQVIIKQHRIDGYLHTSGHAYHDEHVKTFKLLKPKYFLPYHGEYRMSVVHVATAIECGIPAENNILTKNGHVMELIDHKLKLTGEVIDVGPIYIDGKVASKTSSLIINERTALSQQGFINIIAIINKKENRIMGRTRLMSRGAFYVNDIKDEMIQAQKIAHGSILYAIKNDKN